MKTLGTLLDSFAKTEILRALMCQPGLVGVRQVSRLAGVHPHSAELALASLVRAGLVRRRSAAAYPLYEMVRSHPDSLVLEAVFAAATNGFIRARKPLLDARAKGILPFIGSATRMLTRARETTHVT